MAARRAFELSPEGLQLHLETMVDTVFSDLVSEFLLMPMGKCFPKYTDFRNAYEILKRTTNDFDDLSESSVRRALEANSRVLGVVRSILGRPHRSGQNSPAPNWIAI